MNILISVNENYLEYALTMLYSLYLTTKQRITVYLLNVTLSKEEISKVKEFVEKKIGGGVRRH